MMQQDHELIEKRYQRQQEAHQNEMHRMRQEFNFQMAQFHASQQVDGGGCRVL